MSRHRAPSRRTLRPASDGRPISLSAGVGALALALAVVGTLTLSPPAPRAAPRPVAEQAAFAGDLRASNRPNDSLYVRSLPRVSRGGDRSRLAQSAASLRSATAARSAQLESAAQQAKTYADDLTSHLWVLPTSHFHIGTWFGAPGWEWASGYHTGIDFVAPCGTPEVAVAAGKVVQSGWDGPYGNQVRLQLPNGDQVWYNHLVAIRTTVGASLDRGGLVGLVGETGNAYGCHLHLEYRLASDLKTAVDPAPFFLAHGINLHDLPGSTARS